jgi:hypothetical protein
VDERLRKYFTKRKNKKATVLLCKNANATGTLNSKAIL